MPVRSCLARCRASIASIATGLALIAILPAPAPGQATAPAPSVTSPSTSKPNLKPRKTPAEKWEKDIRAFEEADRKMPPPPEAILFIGASSTRRWTTLAQDFPEYPLINRGFGGSWVEDSTYFADRIVIPYKPRLIVLQAGGNDINAGHSPEQVLADIQAFVTKVRAALPETRIAIMAINPAPSRWAQADKQKKANRLIQDYVRAGENLDYIDLWDQFLGLDGKPREDLFVSDRLHNNAEGYKIRAEAVRPHLHATN